MSNTFKKQERLKYKRFFDALFSHGKSQKVYPIRAIYLPFEASHFPKIKDLPENTQVAFSVPKKKFKHAVDRNRIKRQMLESYRLNKMISSKPHAIVFIYLSNKKLNYQEIENAIKTLLENLDKESCDLIK